MRWKIGDERCKCIYPKVVSSNLTPASNLSLISKPFSCAAVKPTEFIALSIAFPARPPASMFLRISAWSVNVECQGTAQGMSEPFSTGDLQEAPPLTDAKLATI